MRRTLIRASALTCLALAAAAVLPAVPGQSRPVAPELARSLSQARSEPAAVRLAAYRPLHAVEAMPERQAVDPAAHPVPASPCTCPGCVDTGC